MIRISPHFSLAELTVTETGLPNHPTDKMLINLIYTAQQMEKVRAILGKPILVSSGYRSPAVNKAVGGTSTSAHSHGFAVDFICPAFGTPYQVCQAIIASRIKFDQLILERRSWVHLGFGLASGISNRQQVLTLKPMESRYLKGLVA